MSTVREHLRNLLLPVLLAGWFLQCGGGSSGGGPASPAPPSLPVPLHLRTESGSTFDELILRWDPVVEPVDGILLEARIGSEPFQPINTDPLSTAFTSVKLTFDSSFPEMVTVGFRARTRRGGDYSAYSTEATYTRGLRPVEWINASAIDGGGVLLQWNDRSQAATQVLIERAEVDGAGTPGAWVEVGRFPMSPAKDLSEALPEGRFVKYRATNLSGVQTSVGLVSSQIQIPLWAPVILKAEAAPEGIQVSWANRSKAATALEILRAPGWEYYSAEVTIATLGTGVTQYLDPSPSMGYYRYRVKATLSAAAGSASASIQAATLNPAGALPLSPLQFQGQAAQGVSLRGNGQWLLTTTSPFGVIAGATDPWPAYFPNNSPQLFGPGALADPANQPHVVYNGRGSGFSQWVVTHAWFDGSAWKTEEVGRFDLSPTSNTCFALDSAGTGQALLDSTTPSFPSGGSSLSWTYAYSQNGAWKTEGFSSLVPVRYDWRTAFLSPFPGGQAVAAFGLSNPSLLRRLDGKWSALPLPASPPPSQLGDFLGMAWFGPQDGCLFFGRALGYGTEASDLWAYALVAGEWKAPLRIGAGLNRPTAAFKVAAIPSQKRFLATYPCAQGVMLFHFQNGSWTQSFLPPLSGSTNPVYGLGADASGRFHVLTLAVGSGVITYTDFHE